MVYQTPFITFNGYSLDGTTIPTVKGKSSKSPVVAIAAPVAGVFALIVIVATFFVVRKKKTERNTGTFLRLVKTYTLIHSLTFVFDRETVINKMWA